MAPLFLAAALRPVRFGAGRSTALPVIPGFTPPPPEAVYRGANLCNNRRGSGEKRTRPPTEIDNLTTELDQAQKVRTLVRQLAR